MRTRNWIFPCALIKLSRKAAIGWCVGHAEKLLTTKGTKVTKGNSRLLNGSHSNQRFHPDRVADRRTEAGHVAHHASVSSARLQRPVSLLVSISPPITLIRLLAAIAFTSSCHSDMADYLSTWRVSDTSKHHWVFDHHWIRHFH